MRQLSGADAFFLYADKPGRHQHVSTIYLYDPSTAPNGKLDFPTVFDHIRDRIGTSRIFRQRLVEVPLNLDFPYWVHDSHFDLDFHVRHIALPKPGDWRQFCILASRLHARPVDLRRPVWEMYVIEGLDNVSWLPEGAFAVLVKVHQVAIDDVTKDDFTIALHDLDAAPEPEDVKRRWYSEQEPGAAQLLALAWFNNARKLIETGQSLLDRLPGTGSRRTGAAEVFDLGGEEAPHTRFDEPVSPYRVLAPFTFDTNAVTAVRAAVPDATMSDIVLTIVSGALRRYLTDKRELPDESLYAFVPLHTSDTGDAGIPGHRIRPIRVRLMTDVADPLERLASVREETAEAKAQHAGGADELSEIQGVLPATAMTFAARTVGARIGPGKHYREQHNTVVTIHPGPAQTLYLCGARLVGYTGMAALMDNLGLNHTVTTYEANVTIAPVCDRQMMPDPDFYYECLRDAFLELCDSAEAASAGGREAGAEASP